MSGTPADHSDKLQGLQVTRGLAASLVVWHHLKYNLGVSSEKVSGIPFLATNLGAIGVDIFFVISGFVIAMTAARLRGQWKIFLAHRIARIVPLYFTISTFALALIISLHFFQNRGLPTFNNIFNSYFFLPLFDTQNFSSPLCANGWTLSFEMWFYLGLCICLAVFGGKLAGYLFPLLMFCGIVLVAAFYTFPNWYFPKFLFNPLAIEFCAGCLLFEFRNAIGKIGITIMILCAPIFLFFSPRYQQLGLHMKFCRPSNSVLNAR